MKEGREKRVSMRSAAVHAGHRQRMRTSAEDDPELNGFSDIELVELLLSFCVPRRDTNVYAHRLLERFGTVKGVLDATESELGEFGFLSASARATLPRLAYLCAADGTPDVTFANRENAVEFFGSVFLNGGGSGTWIVHLDGRFKPIAVERYGDNGYTVRTVIGGVCKYGSKYIYIARCDGERFPNAFDLRGATHAMSETLAALGVRLVDYTVYTEYGYYTLGKPPGRGEKYPVYIFVPYVKTEAGRVRDVAAQRRDADTADIPAGLIDVMLCTE